MKEITEDYCDFETAKLLKEKGMNESCFKHYVQKNNNDGTSEALTVCTLQMAMKWLREAHGVHLAPFPYDVENGVVRYLPEILIISNETQQPEYVEGLNVCKSYEEAVEEAIKYCLENLV